MKCCKSFTGLNKLTFLLPILNENDHTFTKLTHFFTNGHLTNTAMFLAKLFWHRKDQCSLEYAR